MIFSGNITYFLYHDWLNSRLFHIPLPFIPDIFTCFAYINYTTKFVNNSTAALAG